MKPEDWDALIGYISAIGLCMICVMLILGVGFTAPGLIGAGAITALILLLVIGVHDFKGRR